MTDDERQEEMQANLRVADAFIELANDKLAEGFHPLLIAPAMRHAAANFTAFAQANATDQPLDAEEILAEFRRWLDAYDGHHRGKVQRRTPLEQLVEQVEKE